MEHHVHASPAHSTHKSSFWPRFRKNLVSELFNVYVFLSILIVSISAVGMYIFGWIKDFEYPKSEIIKKIFSGEIFPRILIYVLGAYLTLLPMYLVYVLVIAPKKFTFPAVGISMFLSLFMVFLV